MTRVSPLVGPRRSLATTRSIRCALARRSLGVNTVALLILAGCDSAPDERPPDVLLVTIDTLRADHLGLYGYERATSPRIDEWFGQGAIFERAYSTEASTAPSVVSFLSGRLPQEHGVRLFYQLVPDDVPLVSDLLPPGYQRAGFVANMVLTDEALGIGGRFDHYDDFVSARESSRKVFERDARQTTAAALTWLRLQRDPRRALFLWVHYIDPHGPYRPPDDWHVAFERAQRSIDPKRIPRHIRDPGVSDGEHYIERYDSEIAFVDAELGRLLDGYAELAPIEDALVVFTSDHGESMMEHEKWFTHGHQVYEEVVRVPLCVRGPGVPNGRYKQLASGVDLLPTILSFVGTTGPDGLSGQNLLEPSSWPASRGVFAESSMKRNQWRAAIGARDKWIVRVRGDRQVVERRHYDLERDPLELAPGSWDPAAALALELDELVSGDPDPAGVPAQYEAGIQLDAPKVAPNISKEDRQRLRELGYVD